MKQVLTIMATLLIVTSAQGNTEFEVVGSDQPECNDSRRYFSKREEGWFHYKECIHEQEKEEADEKMSQPPSPAAQSADPLEELKLIQLELDRAQAKAVLHPTEQNVLAYMQMVNKHLRRSALFADVSQRTAWANPDLDFRQERPTTPVGLKVWGDEYNAAKRETLKALSEDFGLFFFFTENCKYCHELAPYIQRFAEQYGFSVKAMSLDGGSLPLFPDASYEPKIAEMLSVKTTPAVFLVNPKEQVVEPIAYGPISLGELEDRIYRIFAMDKGQTVFKTK
jgi:conjugal transfer pilus assembly protein TraF